MDAAGGDSPAALLKSPLPVLASAVAVARLEAGLFRRFPRLRVSVLGIVLIPALYAYIYLASVWDPAARLNQLPVVIINHDAGTQMSGRPVALGAELVATLQRKQVFAFELGKDADRARRDVREGRRLFALIIPADFSERAMSADAAGVARLTIYASEGNNYVGASFAKRFASEVSHQINEVLNEQRWEVVLGVSASSNDKLQQLRDGVSQLRQGAAALNAGVQQAQGGARQLGEGSRHLADGVQTLGSGVKQLAAGARALDARKPVREDMQAFKQGAAQLAAGEAEFGKHLPALDDGARKLAQGAAELAEQTEDIPLVGSKIAAGATQLGDGATQLQQGIRAAMDAQAKLAAGARTLQTGADRLTDGFTAYATGVSALAANFPPDGKLDELHAGAKTLTQGHASYQTALTQVQQGSNKLALGLDTLARSLPKRVEAPAGTPQGLADPVRAQLEIDAPVPNNGMGLLPNFVPVALWLGAVMAGFVFHLRRMPVAMQGRSRLGLLLGKMMVLGAINLAQAGCVLLMTWFVLGLKPIHLAGLSLAMVVGSLTFMMIILALVRMFGDAGKAVALILLIVQLSAAGGLMPVELTSPFYSAISPWLPFTWEVKAVRAAAFGAFESDWSAAVAVVAMFGAGAFVLSLLVGQWRFVEPDEHRPAMDV